ncbi:hypothetical protein PIROE2DRAFT_41593, partial [Piromyces sp. E2]
VRTRDQNLLNELDVVYDVGGEYNHEKKRYDHHQKGFNETFSDEYTTKLSSAGLIYKHYGKKIVAKLINWDINDPKTETLYQRLYKIFVECVDGNDNGIPQYNTDIKATYIDSTNISARIARLNPSWNGDNSEETYFIMGTEFKEMLNICANQWMPARDIVVNSIKKRHEVDESGSIVVLDTYCPWKEHLFIIEKELDIKKDELLYVVYTDSGKSSRVQAIPINPNSFTSRNPLPEEWRGLRDEKLSEASGIQDCIFVHNTGFIGGNKTL